MNKKQFSEHVGNIDDRLVAQAEHIPNYTVLHRHRRMRRLLATASVLALMFFSFSVGAMTAEIKDIPFSFNHVLENITDKATDNGIVPPGMQADDGRILVWEEMSEKEIDGNICYAFDLRFSDDENINGEMAGRLIGIYAISKDGTKFYRYNMADDIWE